MKRIVNNYEMRFLEKHTIEKLGVPSLCLMERAALSINKYIDSKDSVFVICGTGNNGADGLALVRMLFARNIKVSYVIIGDESKRTTENITQGNILVNLGLEQEKTMEEIEVNVIIDAIFGIGLSRDIEGKYRDAIEYINDKKCQGTKVISIDVPSGLNSDSGKVMGIAVKSDITVTFEWAKTGLVLNEGPIYAGKVCVESVGIFSDTIINSAAFSYEASDLKYLPDRSILGNKGTFGKVLLIAGSENMAGAAILAGTAVLKTGAGMLKIISHSANRSIIMNELPESMFEEYDAISYDALNAAYKWCDVCVIGPGLSNSDSAKKITEYTIRCCSKKIVIDADALNILSRDITLLKDRANAGFISVLTPHPGEFSRLFNTDIKDKINQDIDFVKNCALAHSVILAAKDARTIVSDGDRVYLCSESSNALATAGSGDVYSGIIAALMCIFSNTFEATCYATLIHSLSGINAASKYGERSVIARDVITECANILK